ncbi:MAG: efflux RND transporter periplasmic adaptor subunit, partial [Planctomycetota bacterium]
LEAVRAKPEVRVGLVNAESGRSADATVVATGYLKSRQQARIGARATGRIQELRVEEGSNVQTNDVIAVLEHNDLDAALAAAKASAARAKSELQEHEVEIQQAEREFARAEKSLALKTMTPAEYEQALYKRDAAIARRSSLEAAAQLDEAQLMEAEQLRENMFVRAPFNGTVISRDAELGESIMPGGLGEGSGRGSVVTIADLEHLEVDCDVKEDFISRISMAQLAEVGVDAVPDRRYKGRVRKIIPMGDRAKATVKVRVEILDDDGRLFPEMSSTVYFLPADQEQKTDESQTRVFCPTEAVITDADTRFVWVVDADNKVSRVTIMTGEARDGRTLVKAGLTGGEKVLVMPPKDLNPGMEIKPVE